MPRQHQELKSRRSSFINMSGWEIGKLLVLTNNKKDSHGNVLWECLCDRRLGGCGSKLWVYGSYLRDAKRDGWEPGCARCRRHRPQQAEPRSPPRRRKKAGRPESSPKKLCPRCYGQPWRIVGKFCLSCGHLREDEPRSHAEITQVNSAVQDCTYC